MIPRTAMGLLQHPFVAEAVRANATVTQYACIWQKISASVNAPHEINKLTMVINGSHMIMSISLPILGNYFG